MIHVVKIIYEVLINHKRFGNLAFFSSFDFCEARSESMVWDHFISKESLKFLPFILTNGFLRFTWLDSSASISLFF